MHLFITDRMRHNVLEKNMRTLIFQIMYWDCGYDMTTLVNSKFGLILGNVRETICSYRRWHHGRDCQRHDNFQYYRTIINVQREDGTIRIENPLEDVIDPKNADQDCRSCRCTALLHN